MTKKYSSIPSSNGPESSIKSFMDEAGIPSNLFEQDELGVRTALRITTQTRTEGTCPRTTFRGHLRKVGLIHK
jgi:hypothetical protein